MKRENKMRSFRAERRRLVDTVDIQLNKATERLIRNKWQNETFLHLMN